MDEILGFAVIGGSVAMLISLVASEIADWRDRRRKARIQQVQRELAETQRQLQDLATKHKAWLDHGAHEARKALILESFHASREGGVGTDKNRSQKHNNVLRRP